MTTGDGKDGRGAPTLEEAREVLRMAGTLFEKLSALPHWAAFADLRSEVTAELAAAAASARATLAELERGELGPEEAMRRAVLPFDEMVRLRARFNNRTDGR